MDSLTALYERMIARLPADPPYLLMVYKVAIAVAGFFIIWMLLRWVLHFVEKRPGLAPRGGYLSAANDGDPHTGKIL
jgi:hypothetical protein